MGTLEIGLLIGFLLLVAGIALAVLGYGKAIATSVKRWRNNR